MTYGPGHGLIGDGAAIQAASAVSARTSARLRTWKALDEERRLQAVDQALAAPANDLIDYHPLAL